MTHIQKIILVLGIVLLFSGCTQEISTEEYLQNGRQFMDQGKLRSAEIEFKNAIKQSPDNQEARILLAQLYLDSYELESAIKELSRALEINSDTETAVLMLAKAYKLAGKSEDLLKRIEVNPVFDSKTQAALHALRGTAFLHLNERAQGLSELNLAKKLDSDSTEVRLAWSTYGEQSERARREWLQPLLTRNGGIPDAWSLLAELEQQNGNLQEAEAAFGKSIELRNYGHIDSAKRALVRLALNDTAGAVDDASYLLKKGAKWPVIHHVLGLVALSERKTNEAQEHFLEALTRDSQYLPSMLYLGIINLERNNLSNAASYLQQYLSRDASSYQANLAYSSLLIKRRQFEQAAEVLHQLNERHPGKTDVLSRLAHSQLLLGKRADARGSLQQALSRDPDNASLRLQYGLLLTRAERELSLGREELKQAIALNSQLIPAYEALFAAYVQERLFDQAGEVAQGLKQARPEVADGDLLLARLALMKGEAESAQQILEKGVETFPGNFKVSDLLAILYLQSNRLDDAKALYGRSFDNEEDNLRAIYRLARVAAHEGNESELQDLLIRAYEAFPTKLAPKQVLSNFYLTRNQPEKAISTLNELEEKEKSLPSSIALMAQAKMDIGEHQHAVRILKTLVARDKRAFSAYLLLAKAYANLSQFQLVRDSLEKALKIQPDHLPGLLALARLDFIQGNIEVFQTQLEYLEKKYPKDQNVLLLRAELNKKNKDFRAAAEVLSEIMENTPRSSVIIDLARIRWASGEQSNAMSLLEDWVKGNPNDVGVLSVLGEFYIAANHMSRAEEVFQTLAELQPDNPVVLNNFAWVLKSSNLKKALDVASKALTIQPENPLVQDTLAMLVLEDGDIPRALELSEKAVQKAPGSLEIQLNYALILFEAGKKQESKAHMQTLMDSAQSDKARQAIREQMQRLF